MAASPTEAGQAAERTEPNHALRIFLIWLPIAGAFVIWLLPLSRYATGSLALLISFAEVGFWIEQATRFDFSRSGLQMSEQANWFGDLGEATIETGGLVRRLQTGLLRTYVLFLAAGAAAVVLAFLIAK